MGSATVQAQIGTGAGPSYANAEGGGKWSLDDALSGSTAIAVPTATGTVFSWIKNFVLDVTGTGTTNISNRRIAMSGAAPTGIQYFFKDVAVASYAQAAGGNRPSSSGSNAATPAGYTLMTTSNQTWDNTSHATSGTGPNGDLVVCCIGVDNTYVGGAGSAISVPSLLLTYDES